MLAEPVHPVTFSPVILLTLLAVLAASWAVFWLLAWRATNRRQWQTLLEWGRETGFRFRPRDVTDAEVPPPFTALQGVRAAVRLCLSGGPTTLVQFQTEPARRRRDTDVGPSGAGPSGDNSSTPGFSVTTLPPLHDVWHLLIRRLNADWRPTGLRPATAAVSALDLFPLSAFPRLGDPERFEVVGADSDNARALAASFAIALLPRDVGLLLHGQYLVLDFSERPFDTIEFNRMRALAEQMAAHLSNPDPVGVKR